MWYTLIALYQGDGATAYRSIDQGMRENLRLLVARVPYTRAVMLHTHGQAALAACRSGDFDRRTLVREVASDARSLRALRITWIKPLALTLDAGVASMVGDHARARDRFERAYAELTASGMMFYAIMVRRRLGELIGGAEGQDAIAEADAWLEAQGVVSPERLTRVFMPEVT